MVYRGKPSQSCKECRERRMKCGKEEPGCKRCELGSRPCSGYRDPLDLMFCNETEGVKKKVISREQARQTANRRTPDLETKSLALSAQNHRSLRPDVFRDTPGRLLLPSLEDRAMGFFVHNYGARAAGSNLEILPSIHNEECGEHIKLAVVAVGLAGLSVATKDGHMKKAALAHYGTALAKTSKLLRHPARVTEDETLCAILLLGLFETVTWNSLHSLNAWSRHIYGATALVGMRGTAQLNTETGVSIFRHILFQNIISSLQCNDPVPIALQNLRKDFSSRLSFPSRKQPDFIVEIYVQLAALRASIRDKDLTSKTEIIAKCLQIDQMFKDWTSYLPLDWNCTEHKVNRNTEDVLDEEYYEYKSLRIAWSWNNYRCGRVVVHEMILQQLLGDAEDTASLDSGFDLRLQLHQSIQTLSQLVAEVAASIPFQLGFPQRRENEGQLPAYRGLSCIWPLYLIGGLEIVPDKARAWVIGRLQFVGRTMGIQQAITLAAVLQIKSTIRIWRAPILELLQDELDLIVAPLAEGETQPQDAQYLVDVESETWARISDLDTADRHFRILKILG